MSGRSFYSVYHSSDILILTSKVSLLAVSFWRMLKHNLLLSMWPGNYILLWSSGFLYMRATVWGDKVHWNIPCVPKPAVVSHAWAYLKFRLSVLVFHEKCGILVQIPLLLAFLNSYSRIYAQLSTACRVVCEVPLGFFCDNPGIVFMSGRICPNYA